MVKFKYGGYTFEPRGQFKEFGIKKGKREFYHISHALHHASWENRFKVADGDEPFNYDEFYKAAGEKKDDVFYCHETGELYVPCAACLQVFDQQSTDEEVEKRYRLRHAKREEHERFVKREALKNALFFTEKQNEAYLEVFKAINKCRDLGVDFAFDNGTLYAFRTDLLKDLDNNMVPMQGQERLELFYECGGDVWDAHEGLYANVKNNNE